ncbi:MAG: hypothetical protein ACK5QD_00910, partial [Brevundimonas sp.]|uniref:hypothetical protein n=1 Tax=Brevundimonas sp. TaxID=1871086 RepID=UPI00391B6CCC
RPTPPFRRRPPPDAPPPLLRTPASAAMFTEDLAGHANGILDLALDPVHAALGLQFSSPPAGHRSGAP